MQGGTTAELDINTLLRKRAGIIATALRSRPVTGPGSKGEIVAEVRERLWPMIASGDVRPVIDAVLDMREAGDAHRRLAKGGHVGKIVLRAPDVRHAATATESTRTSHSMSPDASNVPQSNAPRRNHR